MGYNVELRRPSHEGRGLKSRLEPRQVAAPGRPSHEGRGLKLAVLKLGKPLEGRPSHEGRGLKSRRPACCPVYSVAPHTRGVD